MGYLVVRSGTGALWFASCVNRMQSKWTIHAGQGGQMAEMAFEGDVYDFFVHREARS